MPKTKEKCEEIRENTKNKIMNSALIYFARNGFAGTKISCLSKYIGIGQGTIYSYFKSKEDLYNEIIRMCLGSSKKSMVKLLGLNTSVCEKIMKLSNYLIEIIEHKNIEAYILALSIRVSIENDNNINLMKYDEKPLQILAQLIRDGQEEGTVVEGDETELASYYWSVVQVLSLNKLFVSDTKGIKAEWLSRILIK